MTTEVLTWGVAATLAAEEGIKFLYEQAGALLDRARTRHDAAVASAVSPASEIVANPPSTAFPNAPTTIRLPGRDAALDADTLQSMMDLVAQVIAAYQTKRPPSECALKATGELRALLERLSGQRLTFVGETRVEAADMRVSISVDSLEHKGEVIGVEATGKTAPSTSVDMKFVVVAGKVVGTRYS